MLEVNLILWRAPGEKPVLLGRLRDPEVVGLARRRLLDGKLGEIERLVALGGEESKNPRRPK